MTGTIQIRRQAAQHIGEIVIDNAARGNVISEAMAGQFIAALAELEADPGTKVILISGNGENLSTGLDAADVAARLPAPDPAQKRKPVNQRTRFAAAARYWGAEGLFARILHSPKITITAAQGHCLESGLYLALYSDLTMAADNAVFANPAWQTVGVNGDITMLIAAVGLKRAKEMIYCGAEWDAPAALQYGLIDAIAPLPDLRSAALGLAASCAMIMRDAVIAEKQVVLASLARMQVQTGLEAAAVVNAWGSNIHFRPGEFNVLKALRDRGADGASAAARDFFDQP
jgi:2-(1,2-epoxy-1,2-dihydrophenyl)acetyl-CoA isomerase